MAAIEIGHSGKRQDSGLESGRETKLDITGREKGREEQIDRNIERITFSTYP